jgi:SAM-dependent methyltransferase
MSRSGNFTLNSYKAHAQSYACTDLAHAESWFRDDTVDAWRMNRMFAPFAGYVSASGESSWLTVGDGKFGLDSIRLRKLNPSLTALPTDISDLLLKKAKERGLIADYRTENAERLSFPDEAFDHVLCKESYHHFPRPAVALYEMLRVARKSVLLIEPNDHIPARALGKLVYGFKRLLKKMLGMNVLHSDHFRFEPGGNYVYALSRRELEKTALGMGLPSIAVCYFNDHYEAGVEQEPALPASALFRKIKNEIRRLDRRSAIGLENPRMMAAMLFKETPAQASVSTLEKAGFEIINLPSNPHLTL